MPLNPTHNYPTLLRVFLSWAVRTAESRKIITADLMNLIWFLVFI